MSLVGAGAVMVLVSVLLAPLAQASMQTPTPTPVVVTPTPGTVVNVSASQSQSTFVAVPTIAAKEPRAPEPVSISKSDGRDSAKTGELLTYRIKVRNPNNEDRAELRIVDQVPTFLIPVRITPDAATNPKTRTITWTNQTVSALAEVTFAITARVHASAPDGFVLQNRVDINGPGVQGSASDTTVVFAAKPPAAAPKPPPAPKPPVTVSAPRPVPLGVPTGAGASALLATLGSILSGTGIYFVRRRA